MAGAAIYISNLSSWTPVSLFWRSLNFRLSPRNAHNRPFNPQLPCKLKSKQTVWAWALSLVVPLFLLATLVPVDDVVVRIGPQCFPSLHWHGSGTGMFSRVDRTTTRSYNLEDRDYLIRTVAFEAANEPSLGKAAVAHVVLNRKKTGRWGYQIKKIVTQPWQFEPWMTRRKEIENLSPDDPRYRKAARIADAVLDGDIPDPTSGATHFLNEAIVRQRRGGSLPRWAQGEGLVIGRHTFYWPDEAGAGMRRASLALMFMQLASLSC
jgi:N-acetylmuramoyl-L-alanine amidase